MKSFYWYDLETSGRDPRTDRILQFAGQRTDETLAEVGAPTVLYCRLPDEVLPDPEALMVTGLTPQRVEREGLDERTFAAKVEADLSVGDTCVAGFNNLRFDDEFIRFLFYRNFYDPYAREWREGNSRWDLLDLARTAGALRPEGMNWPRDEDGDPVYRLEALAEANGVSHDQAHDALYDVRATIGLARHVKRAQPRLFAYSLRLSDRKFVESLLLPLAGRPLVHVSRRFPRKRHCLALVATVARHPVNRNAYVAWDLSVDPEPLLTRSSQEIRDLLSTPSAERGEEAPRVGLKLIRSNRCPSLAPVSVVRAEDRERLSLDVKRAMTRLRWIQAHSGIAERLESVYGERAAFEARDVEGALYDGFVSDEDRDRFPDVRDASPEALA
ncbi:MAG: exodeoxyribonuclease I, partial [Gammaproteobacteria bacterium]